ncbi:MAG: toll/interleukin-1 receptor domain-containing protein [Burkholderiales bacterium]|nr:MAG: toll/interleukin-1 receptor domain-containing protein [Burkholderiales bacterium]
MPISFEQLQQASFRSSSQAYRTTREAKAAGRRTAFLCHSHADQALVKGVVQLLRETGWQVYVDWMDATMPAIPDRTTAATIKNRIIQADWFLFLATGNSMSSRWCPWEIGYADGVKPIERIIVIPTRERYTTHGNEYLQLYRHVDISRSERLAVYDPGETNGIFVENLAI